MENESFIRCEGLVKTYLVASLDVVALQGLDLVVQRGERVGIIGPSGSGKTTLLNILGGLDLPSAGQVWVDGMGLHEASPAALDRYRSARVGFIWQQAARNLIPSLGALENVRMAVILAGHSQVSASRRAAELLEAAGLAERSHAHLEELPAGEQQRVAIAAALANHPTLLLADEPAGELDPAGSAAIYRVFQNLHTQFGLTTIIATRDPAVAGYVDRVVSLRDGRAASEAARPSTAAARPPEATDQTVLLDPTGRFQIPPDYLAHFNIRDRARVSLTEQGILIVPDKAIAVEPALAPAFAQSAPAQAAQPAPPAAPTRPSASLSGLFDRLRRRPDRK